jgi:hypothetical protein
LADLAAAVAIRDLAPGPVAVGCPAVLLASSCETTRCHFQARRLAQGAVVGQERVIWPATFHHDPARAAAVFSGLT